MRVLFCKIHCPSFICFCKPSSHIYTPGPLKLEHSSYVPSATTTTVASVSDDDHSESIEVNEEKVVEGKKQQQEGEEEEEEEEEGVQNCGKSSLKKEVSDSKEDQKKKVQWMDFLGKELVEIKEFEASEIEDTDNESEFSKGCVCTIL